MSTKHQLRLGSSVLLHSLKIVEMKFTYKDTGQYSILCNHCNHVYHDQDNADKRSLGNNYFFRILTKKVMKHIIYPSRRSSIAQQYIACTKYPQTSLILLLYFMKKDISRQEGIFS